MNRAIFRLILATALIVAIPVWIVWGAGCGLQILWKRLNDLWWAA